MPSYKYLTFFFSLCFALLINNFSYSQVGDSLTIGSDTIDVQIEEIILTEKGDNSSQELKEITNPIDSISLSQLENIDTLTDTNIKLDYYSDDHWSSIKVNPYTDVILPTPFKIEFNQTTFTHPINGKIVITSRFGRRRRGPHGGLDIDLITGDSVRSVLPGKVRFVGYSRGHGKTVVIRHANEVETVYAHLSDYKVKVNDIISEGQVLGLGGNTGNSRGSHLHLEVRYKGVRIHPEYVFNFDGSNTIRSTELWVTNGWKSPRFHSSYRKSKLSPLSSEKEAIAAQNAEPKYHRVRKGDTLSHISRKYNLGVRQICSLNTISRNSTLRIGQILQVR